MKITESKAIMRHIARVFDATATLLPNEPKLACKVDMLECIIFEALMGVAMFAFQYDVSDATFNILSSNCNQSVIFLCCPSAVKGRGSKGRSSWKTSADLQLPWD